MLIVGICHVNPRSKVLKGSGVHVRLVFTVFPQSGSGCESRIVVFLKATKGIRISLRLAKRWHFRTVGVYDSGAMLLTLTEPSACFWSHQVSTTHFERCLKSLWLSRSCTKSVSAIQKAILDATNLSPSSQACAWMRTSSGAFFLWWG